MILALGCLLIGALGFAAGWFARASRPRTRIRTTGRVLDFTPRVVSKDDVA